MSCKYRISAGDRPLTVVLKRRKVEKVDVHYARQKRHPRISPKDRLSSLPAEVLSQIFDFVRIANGDEQMRGGISRTLRRYTEANYFYRVCPADMKHYDRFVGAIQTPMWFEDEEAEEYLEYRPFDETRREYISSLVRVFEFEHEYDMDLDMDWDDPETDTQHLFTYLPRLIDLTISFCPPISNAFFSHSPSITSRAYLKHLKFSFLVQGKGMEKPFGMGRFRFLLLYDNLVSLHLNFFDGEMRGYGKGKQYLPEIEKIPTGISFPSIRSLELRTTRIEYTTDLELATFLACFVNLDRFDWEDNSNDGPHSGPDFNFTTVLGRVNKGLRHLGVAHDNHEGDLINLEAALLRFPRLEILKLGQRAINAGNIWAIQWCPLLRMLHIDRPEYGARYVDEDEEEIHSACQDLLELFQDGTIPPKLTELRIDFPAGKVGSDLFLLDVHPRFPWSCKWELPAWQGGFTVRETLELIDEAEEWEVKVTGEILKAVRVQEEWERGMEEIGRKMAMRMLTV